MSSTEDLRSRIRITQDGACACFLICNYKGKERQFLYIPGDTVMMGHVTECNNVGNEALELRISNIYDNKTTCLVPDWLPYREVTSEELLRLAMTRDIWLNAD